MQYLLAFFFLVMYAGDQLGLNVGLAPGLSFKNLLLYLVVIGIALETAVARNRTFELSSVSILFALLILYALMTWIAVAFVFGDSDYDMRQSFIVLKSGLADQFITFLVFFFGIVHAKDAFWLLRVMLWIVVLGNIITIIDAFNIPNLGIIEGRLRDDRFEGFIGSANGYGQFLTLFVPSTVALYLSVSGKLRLVAGLGVFATALALVLTGSRGAYAGLLAGSVLASFYLRKMISTQKLVRAGVTAVAVLVLVLSVSFIAGYADLFIARFARFEGSAHVATSGRSTIWFSAIQAMIENPWSFLTGYGFNAYESSRSFYAATHNMYLTYLYNLGAIGLTLFIAVFGQVVARARRALAYAPVESKPFFLAFVFGLFGFLVAILFSEYHVLGYFLWAFVGVIMRMAMYENADEPALQHS